MKIAGQTIEPPKSIEVPILKLDKDGNEYFIVFKLKPVMNFDAFNAQFPPPTPPTKRTSKMEYLDYENPEYKEKALDYRTLRLSWMFLQATKDTDIEWDTVTEDPATWPGYEKELMDNGFTYDEIVELLNKILQLSGLNSTNLEEARKRFLALREESAKS